MTTLWYTRCPIPTAAGIAVQTGMLAEEFAPDGIEVRSLSASASRRVHESHFDHTQPDSFRHGGNVPPIWSRSRGADTAVVALSWTDEYQSIIALPESGIAAPADLKGRRIGLPARVNDQIDFYRSMCLRGTLHALALAGLDERDVRFVKIPVEENYIGATSQSQTGQLWSGAHRARRSRAEAFALVRGEIDAVYTSGALGLFLRDFLGARDIVDLGFHADPAIRCNNDQPTVLTVSGPLARERPAHVARFLGKCPRAAGPACAHRRDAARPRRAFPQTVPAGGRLGAHAPRRGAADRSR